MASKKQPTVRVSESLMEDGTKLVTEEIMETGWRESAPYLKTFMQHIIERGDMIVGLDIKWRSDFSSNQPVALITFCTQIKCLLLKTNGVYSQFLQQLFGNKDIIFVGVYIKIEVKLLRKCCSLEIENVVDLSELAADVLHKPRLRAFGVRLLASEILLEPFKARSASMA
ncbi:hypothetical protein COLO4_15525 [Corchorus olitorius]|uniref:3'-5' exonuclease domain-containing protein n=1 Tax=Corchorus olitorius TaxID=93759 RepID=A0A1R3JMI1_9ROSI|nr:hypothetical protein COLO4_15525 [Corchorus olitorius]